MRRQQAQARCRWSLIIRQDLAAPFSYYFIPILPCVSSTACIDNSELHRMHKIQVYLPTKDIYHKGQSSEERRQAAADVTDVRQDLPVDFWNWASHLQKIGNLFAIYRLTFTNIWEQIREWFLTLSSLGSNSTPSARHNFCFVPYLITFPNLMGKTR